MGGRVSAGLEEDDAAAEVDGELLFVDAFDSALKDVRLPRSLSWAAELVLLFVGKEAADFPQTVGVESYPTVTSWEGADSSCATEGIAWFNSGDDADLPVVGGCGRRFICQVGFDEGERLQLKGGRDVPNLLGYIGFGGAAEAVTTDKQGYDQPGDGEEGDSEEEESTENSHRILIRSGEVQGYAAEVAALVHELEGGFPLGPGEGVGDDGADFAFGHEPGGLFDVASGRADGADYLLLSEDYFGEGEFGFGAFDFAEEDEAGVGGEGARRLGEEGGADGVEGNVCASVFGEGEDDFGEVELAGGNDVGRAEGLEVGGLGFVGGYGEDAGAAKVGELDEVGAEAAASAGYQDGFVGLDSGFFDGFEGYADGAGEEGGLRPWDFFGDFDEGGLADGEVLGHAAFHAVADGLTLRAESLEV